MEKTMNTVDSGPWRGIGDDHCPLSAALRLLGGKHTTMVMHCLVVGDLHFLELCRALPHVSRKVLTDELRALIAAEIVTRTEEGDALGRVRYGLSPRGRELAEILGHLYDWAAAGSNAGQVKRWKGT